MNYDQPNSEYFRTEEPLSSEKTKTRRRGCGHPYRMRLNMSDPDRHQSRADCNRQEHIKKRLSSRRSYERHESPQREKRVFSEQPTVSQQESLQNFSPSTGNDRRAASFSDTHHQQTKDSLSDDSDGQDYYINMMNNRSEKTRRSRGLFPYNQRNRKKHQHGNSSRPERADQNRQFINFKDSETQEPFVDSGIEVAGNKIENSVVTRVVYKKRRQVFSPSS